MSEFNRASFRGMCTDALTPLPRMLEEMSEHGQSVMLSFGEDNGCWECSWITGGKRFTGYGADANQSVRSAINKMLVQTRKVEPS